MNNWLSGKAGLQAFNLPLVLYTMPIPSDDYSLNLTQAIMSRIADLELSIHHHDQQLSYTVDFRYTDRNPDNQANARLRAKQKVV